MTALRDDARTRAGAAIWMHAFLDVPHEAWEPARRFWIAVTGWTESAVRGERGQFATLLPRVGSAWLKLQRSDADDARAGVHLDLDSPDPAAAARVARAAGAVTAWRYDGVEVMRSPGGMLFCHTVGAPGRAPRDGSGIVDQVCLDVPPASWQAEVAFWATVTGRDPQEAALPQFVRLHDLDPAGGLRLLVQRRDEGAGPVSAHLDLATADRARETERHRSLGARVERIEAWWTVLLAPGGHCYCLTDRDPLTGLSPDPTRSARSSATASPTHRTTAG